PPTYVQQDDTGPSEDASSTGPQIIITSTTDSLRFQQGYLGADGERAAIEGELQIKGIDGSRWRKVTIDLRTVEAAYQNSIELAHTELSLYDVAEEHPGSPIPSSLPFSIPLMADSPQCIHTPQSSLSHNLTATLHPVDPLVAPLTKTLTVHTRRFITHTHTIPTSPVRRTLHNPARIEVEIPRTTFSATEPIPIYVTVPTPSRELVVEEGLRLRNIKAELVRTVRVREQAAEEEDLPTTDVDVPSDSDDDDDDGHNEAPLGVSLQSHDTKLAGPSTSSSAYARAPFHRDDGALYQTVVSRSGALCRFHTSRPVRLRFVLRQSSPTSSPSDSTRPLPGGEYGLVGSDTECGTITQSTLLHTVAFRLRIHATFRHTSTHTERVSTVSIPITLLPPPAPLPEVERSMDFAYHKKHDAPPVRTVRGDEADAAPHYEEGQAGPSYIASGPSYIASGAPPPFEERDAPPPFSHDGSSSHLPTFLESEQEIYVPPGETSAVPPPHVSLPLYLIEGEGVLFGFPASAQFSGHSDDMTRGGESTPPPTLEMATLDANVTDLARLDLGAPERAMQALGLALQHHEEVMSGEPLPPPPPPMDDPADPPPSIHSEYRSREGVAHQMPSALPPPASFQLSPPPSQTQTTSVSASPAHAPPPYLGSEGERDHENVSRPPPYVDFMAP
ncbi:hypothetical protein OF83DRAFT_1047550, partial [Amylostereum chailletii]